MTDKKQNSFTLGVAKNRKGENSPTHTGKIILNGKTYFLSGWQKQNEDGSFWYSGYVNEPENNSGNGGKKDQASNPQPKAEDMGDDIPF